MNLFSKCIDFFDFLVSGKLSKRELKEKALEVLNNIGLSEEMDFLFSILLSLNDDLIYHY